METCDGIGREAPASPGSSIGLAPEHPWRVHRRRLALMLKTGALPAARRGAKELARRIRSGTLRMDPVAAAQFAVLHAEILLSRGEGGWESPGGGGANHHEDDPRAARARVLLDALGALEMNAARLAPGDGAGLRGRWLARRICAEIRLLERERRWPEILRRLPGLLSHPILRATPEIRARVLLCGGRAARRMGQTRRAARCLRAAIAGAQRGSDGALLARSLATLGDLQLRRGRLREALSLLTTALDVQTSRGLLADMVVTRLAIAEIWRRRGALRAAADWHAETAQIAAACGDSAGEMDARLERTRIILCLREDRQARAAALDCVSLSRVRGSSSGMVAACALLAAAHVRAAALSRAEVPLRRARRLLACADAAPGLRARFRIRCAEFHLARGELKEASASAEQAIVPAREAQRPELVAAALRLRGEAALVAGERPAACDLLERAHRALAHGGDLHECGLVELALSKARGSTRVAGFVDATARREQMPESALGVRRLRAGAARRLASAGVPVEGLDLFSAGPVEFRTRAHVTSRLAPRGGAPADGGETPQRWARFGIITRHARLHAELLHLARVAPSSLPVLVHGETGVGKELVARALHEMSGLAGRFVVFNAASARGDLLEAELFGHCRGAFTGAHRDREGVIAQAAGGTLFLDEIADLRLSAQAALLRFLDRGEVRPVGADVSHSVRTRVVAASHRSLRRMVAQGRFRQDLFFRLAGVEIHVPPLRARREDIVPLLFHAAERRGVRAEEVEDLLAAGLAEPLLAYAWPGNVRQLCHWADQLAALARGSVARSQMVRLLRAPLSAAPGLGAVERRGTAEADRDPRAGRGPELPARDELIRLLEAHRGNISGVAHDLHTYRTQVYRWACALGVDPRRHRPRRGGTAPAP